jgi:lycopene cyclase domain-containing protein
MSYLYLLINLFTISYPLAQSFEKRLQYYKRFKALFIAIAITGSFFIVWDIWFTSMGVWGFNERYLTGIHISLLPLEEWLFFLTVPFASVFIYECVWYFIPQIRNFKGLSLFTILLGVVLIGLSIVFRYQAYTFCNFLFAGIFTLYVGWKNPSYLAKFWTSYFIHLIPFLLVNGILTGSYIEEEVVWYNNLENLAIRLYTIPVEDTVYSLLLLLMNIYFYELFIKKFNLSRTRPIVNG